MCTMLALQQTLQYTPVLCKPRHVSHHVMCVHDAAVGVCTESTINIIVIITTSTTVPLHFHFSTPRVLRTSPRPTRLGAWCHRASGTPVGSQPTSMYLSQSDLGNKSQHLDLPGSQHFCTPYQIIAVFLPVFMINVCRL